MIIFTVITHFVTDSEDHFVEKCAIGKKCKKNMMSKPEISVGNKNKPANVASERGQINITMKNGGGSGDMKIHSVDSVNMENACGSSNVNSGGGSSYRNSGGGQVLTVVVGQVT